MLNTEHLGDGSGDRGHGELECCKGDGDVRVLSDVGGKTEDAAQSSCSASFRFGAVIIVVGERRFGGRRKEERRSHLRDYVERKTKASTLESFEV